MTKNALEAINNLDNDMIFSAMEKPEEKKKLLKFGKIRWTAAAACIAILMAVPVMAEVFGFTLDFDAIGNYWNANTDASFSAEEYSEAVRAVKGQQFFVMQDMSEAEEFLGIDMPDNAVLEESEKRFVKTEFNESGIEQEVHCDVFVGENEGNLLVANTNAWYNYNPGSGITINITYYTVCAENPIEGGGGFGYGLEDELSKSEKYITPSGRECEIVSIEGEYDYQEMAVTEVNRVLVSVMVYGQEKESVRSAVVKILDAYN